MRTIILTKVVMIALILSAGGGRAQQDGFSAKGDVSLDNAQALLAQVRGEDPDLDQLIEALRAKLKTVQDRNQSSQIPVGQLAQDLETARRDVERMAELLLRQEISGVQQKASLAIAQERASSLEQSLSVAESRMKQVLSERERLQTIAKEGSERILQLANDLKSIDEEKERLSAELKGSEEQANRARTELARANQRLEQVDLEISAIEHERLEAEKALETNISQTRSQLTSLGSEIQRRDRDITRLQESQERAREALVTALVELNATTPTSQLSSYEREMLARAQASNTARQRVLEDMGFKRDANGQLIPPDIEPQINLAAIEPAAGTSRVKESCITSINDTQRGYLDDEASRDWEHFLITSVEFQTAAASFQSDFLEQVKPCLDQLALDPAIYFKVVGHTDSRGPASENQKLSLERAQRVKNLLSRQVTSEPWRIFALGVGERFPLASNENEQGRMLNRRVEVFAVKAPY